MERTDSANGMFREPGILNASARNSYFMIPTIKLLILNFFLLFY